MAHILKSQSFNSIASTKFICFSTKCYNRCPLTLNSSPINFEFLYRKFKIGDRVLLYNSRLKLFSRKLESRWSGPYTVISITQYGAIGVKSSSGGEFKVNGQRLKHFAENHVKLVEAIDMKE